MRQVWLDSFNQEGASEMHYLLTTSDACVADRRDDQSSFVFDDGFKNQWSQKNKVFMMCAPDVSTCARQFHFETKNFKKFQNVELAVDTQRTVRIFIL